MVSPICKAKKPAECPWHGAVAQMYVAEHKLVKFVKANGNVSPEILDEYVAAKNAVVELERQGWDEDEYVKQVEKQTHTTKNDLPVIDLSDFEVTPTVVTKQQVEPSLSDLRDYEVRKSRTIVPVNGDHTLSRDDELGVAEPDTNDVLMDIAYRKQLDSYNEAHGLPYSTMGWKAQNNPDLQEVTVDRYDEYTGERVVGEKFTRYVPGTNFPDTPYQMRFSFERPITDEEARHLNQLIGYTYRSTIRGEALSDPYRDTPFSFVVYADTTKSSSDDLGMAFERFHDELPEVLQNGSPVRKTDRAGTGTKGTRLIQGFGEDVKMNIYYDDIT